MLTENDPGTVEYRTLMERCRSIERSAGMTWTIGTTAAAGLLAWAIADNSAGRMLTVVFAAGAGFYPLIHARQQVRLTSAYLEEFTERRSSLQWHTKLGQLRVLPGVNPTNDWIMTALSILPVIAAVVFSWMFAESAKNGAVMAGIVTACGVALTLHSSMETQRIAQTDFTAVWRRVSAGPRPMDRPGERATS